MFAFGCPTCLPNFSLIKAFQFLCLCEKKNMEKTKKKNWNFGLLYLIDGWCDLLQIWNVASHHRWALPQQIWCSSDKRSRIHECVKIATLLLLLIYSLLFTCTPGFLGRTKHYRVSWYSKLYYFLLLQQLISQLFGFNCIDFSNLALVIWAACMVVSFAVTNCLGSQVCIGNIRKNIAKGFLLLHIFNTYFTNCRTNKNLISTTVYTVEPLLRTPQIKETSELRSVPTGPPQYIFASQKGKPLYMYCKQKMWFLSVRHKEAPL